MDVQIDFFHAHLEGCRQCGFGSNGRCHDVISIVVRGGIPDPEAKADPRRSRLLTLLAGSPDVLRCSPGLKVRGERRCQEWSERSFEEDLFQLCDFDRDFSLSIFRRRDTKAFWPPRLFTYVVAACGQLSDSSDWESLAGREAQRCVFLATQHQTAAARRRAL